jgi:hypothetical protein
MADGSAIRPCLAMGLEGIVAKRRDRRIDQGARRTGSKSSTRTYRQPLVRRRLMLVVVA